MSGTTHTGSTSTPTILDMPLPGTEKAPRKFKGEYSYVKDFLKHYERLLNQCKITDNTEKCTGILQYCSKLVRETIEGLVDYQRPNWDQLKATLLRLYDSERNDKRHSERELKAFIDLTKGANITHLSQFRNYERHFMRIAGWLRGQKKLTDTEMNKKFWAGLPKNLKRQIELKMSINNHPLDLTTPFPIDRIVQAAEEILHRDRFDADESEGQEMDYAENDSDSDSGSDDEYAQVRAKAKNKKMSKKTKKTLKDLWTEEEEYNIKKKEEIEILIQELAQMSVSDPNYGLLYYRALSKDPNARLSIRPPQLTKPIKNPDIPQKPLNTGLRSSFGCYGCGAQDHGMSNCPALSELVTQGIIKRGMDNRYIMKDGSKIFRDPGETFVQAAKRLDKSNRQSTNYVAIERDDFPNTVHNSYAAQRQFPNIKDKQTEKFDGVYPPSISKSKLKRKNVEQVSEPGLTSRMRQEPIPVIVPIDVHDKTPTFNPDNDQDIIEDISSDKTKPQRKPKTPYASTISNDVDPMDILEKALSAPVTLTVKQVVGGSKGISDLLLQLLKYKRTSIQESEEKTNHIENNVTHHVHDIHSSSQGVLIKIKMMINGFPLRAIIDTGSTCNIMHYSVFQILGLPIDKTVTPVMSDANGGGKVMVGLVKDVLLSCGSVETKTDIFVATHVPFELLLGRPWQRGNYVSIDERHDGTYVVFKNPFDPTIHYELLGVPEYLHPEYKRMNPTWNMLNDAFPLEHSIFYSKKLEQNQELICLDSDQHDLPLLSSMERLNFLEWPTEEMALECQAKSCQGSVRGQRPISEYIHKVRFPDAYDEDDTVLYQVCRRCHIGCKRKSQGGSLINTKKIIRDPNKGFFDTIQEKSNLSQLCHTNQERNNYDLDEYEMDIGTNFEIIDYNDLSSESDFYDVQECNNETSDQAYNNGTCDQAHDNDTCHCKTKNVVSPYDNNDSTNNQDKDKDSNVSQNNNKKGNIFTVNQGNDTIYIRHLNKTVGADKHNTSVSSSYNSKTSARSPSASASSSYNSKTSARSPSASASSSYDSNASASSPYNSKTSARSLYASASSPHDSKASASSSYDSNASTSSSYESNASTSPLYTSNASASTSCSDDLNGINSNDTSFSNNDVLHSNNSNLISSHDILHGNNSNVTNSNDTSFSNNDVLHGNNSDPISNNDVLHSNNLNVISSNDTSFSNNDVLHGNNSNLISSHDALHSDNSNLISSHDALHSDNTNASTSNDSNANASSSSKGYKYSLKSYIPPQKSSMQPKINIPEQLPTPASTPDPESAYSYAELWTDSLLQVAQGQYDGRTYQDFITLYSDLQVTDEDGISSGPSYGGSTFIRIYDEPFFIITALQKEDPRAVPGEKEYGAMIAPKGANHSSYLTFAKANPEFIQKATAPVYNTPLPSLKPYTFPSKNTNTSPLDTFNSLPNNLCNALNKAARVNGWDKKKRKRKGRKFKKAELEEELFGEPSLLSSDGDSKAGKASLKPFQKKNHSQKFQKRVKLWLDPTLSK